MLYIKICFVTCAEPALKTLCFKMKSDNEARTKQNLCYKGILPRSAVRMYVMRVEIQRQHS